MSNDIIKNYHVLVSDYFFNEDTPTDEIGIEIEVEGEGLPTDIPSYWEVHHDGSLRGESAEYVLKEPIKRKNVLPFLEYLKGKLRNSVIHDSIRTSVHVHINMAEKTILQVYVILIVYFILENLIIELAGKNRIGNLFCLRLKDAEYLLDQLIIAAQKDSYKVFLNEQTLRYAAVNVCALSKFNSLEFRAMRGTTDPEIISEWVEILLSVVDNAVNLYKTPLEVIQDFSAIGPGAFAEKILGIHLHKFKEHNIHKVLWSGIRLVQSLAYCTDWTYTNYKPVAKLFATKKKTDQPPPLLRSTPRVTNRIEPPSFDRIRGERILDDMIRASRPVQVTPSPPQTALDVVESMRTQPSPPSLPSGYFIGTDEPVRMDWSVGATSVLGHNQVQAILDDFEDGEDSGTTNNG